jgi:hypothetical protein
LDQRVPQVMEPEEKAAEAPPGSPADAQARLGLLLAWIAFYLAGATWVAVGIYLVGFRTNPYVAPWFMFPCLGGAAVSCVLSRLALARVRFSTPLHGALDFIASIAWHMSWTCLLVVLLGFSQYWSAYKAELQRLQEEYELL